MSLNSRPPGTEKAALFQSLKGQHKTNSTSPLTKIIDSKSLKHTGCVANEERALVVSDGDDQGAAQAYHEVRHCEAEDKDGHGLEQSRAPEQHSYHETVVKNRQQCVDEHEERKNTVAQPREDRGCHGYHLGVDGRRVRARAPRGAVRVHGA